MPSYCIPGQFITVAVLYILNLDGMHSDTCTTANTFIIPINFNRFRATGDAIVYVLLLLQQQNNVLEKYSISSKCGMGKTFVNKHIT